MDLRRALLQAALLAAGTPGPASAQAAPEAILEEVAVRVEVGAAGAARVTARYQVRLAVPDTLVVSAVPYFGLGIGALEASAGGAPIPIVRGTGRALEVRLPVGSGASEVRVVYVVPASAAARGDRIDLRVPLLLPRATPRGSAADFFRVELIGPGDLHVIESFPSVRDAGGSADALHTMTLPVAPGLLRWRLTTGSQPRLTFAGAVDLGVVLLLGLLAVAGVRALRRPLSEP